VNRRRLLPLLLWCAFAGGCVNVEPNNPPRSDPPQLTPEQVQALNAEAARLRPEIAEQRQRNQQLQLDREARDAEYRRLRKLK